jgi:hypothetical protein
MYMRRSVLLALFAAALAALPFAFATYRALLLPNGDWVGPTGNHFGLDFVNFWSAGRLVLEGLVDKGYDPQAYKALLQGWFAPATGFTNLSYPPSLLPWLAPLALIPFLAAYVLWSAAGVGTFVAAAIGRTPQKSDWPLVLALVISPVVISNIVFGQIALLVTGLFIAAMRLMPARPVLAGVLIGCMTVKPQLGLLIPVFLLALGAWRTIAAAGVTTAALGAISIALFGIEPWRAYLTDTAGLQWSYILAMNDFYAIHMTTPYAALWTVGVPVKTALSGQWLASAAIIVITVLVARSKADWALKVSVLAMGSVMVVPYSLAHDLAMPLAALVWWFSVRTDEPPPLETGLLGLLWMLPFPLTFLVQAMGLPVTEIVMIALYSALTVRAMAPERVKNPPALAPAGS